MLSYIRQGFLPLPKFFKPEELDPVRKAVEIEVDDLANKLFNAGKITGIMNYKQCRGENSDIIITIFD